MNAGAIALARQAVAESVAMTRQWIRDGMPPEDAIEHDWEAGKRLAGEARGDALHDTVAYLAALLAVATYELAALRERIETPDRERGPGNERSTTVSAEDVFADVDEATESEETDEATEDDADE